MKRNSWLAFDYWGVGEDEGVVFESHSNTQGDFFKKEWKDMDSLISKLIIN